MFDVDFNDLDLGSKKKPKEWAVVAPATQERGALKQHRGQVRRGNGNATGDVGSHPPQNVRHRNRMPRGLRTKERREKTAEYTEELAERIKYKNEEVDPTVTMLPCEDEDSNVEYKLRLSDPSQSRLQQLITQMKYRLSEGSGECFYYIGVEDRGYPRGLDEGDLRVSLNNVNYMAEALRATASLVRIFPGAHSRLCALVQVRRNCVEDVNYMAELRICVGGSVDNGKSSLIAVLTHGVDGTPVLDNGKGSARTSVFRHKHEIQTGHTSSISQTMLGYDAGGAVLNYAGFASLTTAEISAAAHKVMHFIDLGGHERFLKTALYGMTSLLPDFMMLCVCASTGVAPITKEHFAAAVALDIPVLCAITKADSASAATLAQTLHDVRMLLCTAADVAKASWGEGPTGGSTEEWSDVDMPHPERRSSSGVFDAEIDTAEDARRRQVWQRKLDRQVPIVDSPTLAERCAQVMCIIQQQQHPLRCRSYIIPCFLTSAVTGMGIDLLHTFFKGLEQSARHKQPLRLQHQHSLPASYTSTFQQQLGNGSHRTLADPSLEHFIRPPPPLNDSQTGQESGTVAAQRDRTAEQTAAVHNGASADTAVSHSHAARQRQSPACAPHSSSHTTVQPGSPGGATGCEMRTPGDPAPRGKPENVAANGTNDAVADRTALHLDLQAGTPLQACVGQGDAQQHMEATSGNESLRPTSGGMLPALGDAALASSERADADLVHFQVDHVFDVTSVGIVVSGTVVVGTIRVGDQLWWGPTSSGEFTLSQVVSIHRSSVPVIKVQAGQTAALALEAPGPPTAPQTLSSLFLPSASSGAGSRVPSLGYLSEDASPGMARHSNTAPPAHGAPGFHTDPPVPPEPQQHTSPSGTGSSVLDPPSMPAVSSSAPPATAPDGPADASATPSASRPVEFNASVTPTVSAQALSTTPTPSAAAAAQGHLSLQLSGGSRQLDAALPARKSSPQVDGRLAGALERRSSGEAQLRRSRTSLSRTRTSSSPEAMSPDPSWHLLGLGLAGLPEEGDDVAQVAAKGRKGAVLLDQRITPRTASEFDAVMVLLNGQWPPRGLVTGCWPPDDAAHEALTPSPSQPSLELATSVGRDKQRRSRTRSHRPKYNHIIHCGSVRQEAQVRFMREMQANEIEDLEGDGMNIIAAAAAAAVLCDAYDDDEDCEGSGQGDNSFIGCVVEIKFKFTLRPEWLQPGMRFLVRDQSGHISGAGVITKVHCNT